MVGWWGGERLLGELLCGNKSARLGHCAWHENDISRDWVEYSLVNSLAAVTIKSKKLFPWSYSSPGTLAIDTKRNRHEFFSPRLYCDGLFVAQDTFSWLERRAHIELVAASIRRRNVPVLHSIFLWASVLRYSLR